MRIRVIITSLGALHDSDDERNDIAMRLPESKPGMIWRVCSVAESGHIPFRIASRAQGEQWADRVNAGQQADAPFIPPMIELGDGWIDNPEYARAEAGVVIFVEGWR